MRGSTTTLLGTAVVAATCLVPFADGDAVRADHETPVVELLTDIDDVPVDAEIDHLTATSTHVFFEARGSVAFGRELWAYSIADDEFSMVHDLSEGWDDTDILATTVVDDTFYFVAEGAAPLDCGRVTGPRADRLARLAVQCERSAPGQRRFGRLRHRRLRADR
ncbi:MAG: hypothetical protein R2697_03480 [Ilumatobacteraceae bacterium]